MTDDKTKIASDTDEHFVALHSGFTLGKYELQAVLGQGGFGITYKAWDSALKRAVAIKEYLPSDVAVRVGGATVRARSRNDQESFQWGLERFLEEARALARFEASQSIVRVYDYMQDNGTAYMVMALIEGTPLSSVYRREAPLSEERLKAIVLPILDGLDDVHHAGFLHRDIKPANILIRPSGAPVLIDFGAARNALGEKSRSITSVFTPGYAPFEQYTSSGKQGPWTDIYALAATLYHGITGKPPPQATDRIRDDPMLPAVHAGAGHYSPQFLASVDRGLEVFENRRPQSIGQWRDMLTGATTLAVPQSYAAPQQGAANYAPNSQPGNTAVPTLGERGVPSQAPISQGPVSQGPVSQGPVSQGPVSQGPVSQGPASQAPYSQTPPRKSRLPLIAAAVALVLVGGGAAAFFALSPSSEKAAAETVQQRAQRLADEARRAADQARLAQDAAEAEMKKRAEQEAAQKAAEETRRRADADLARQAEQARREADRAQRDSDGEGKRKADEEVRKIAEAEAARRLESEKLEQERRSLEAARAKAETELAEARRQAEEARSQADALRAQAEKSRAAAAEADAKRKAEDEARKKAEAEAKVKAEAEAKARAEADAKVKAEAAKKKAEDDAKADAAAKAKADEEARRAQAARAPAPTPAPAPQVAAAAPDATAYLKQHWPAIKDQVESTIFRDPSTYTPTGAKEGNVPRGTATGYTIVGVQGPTVTLTVPVFWSRNGRPLTRPFIVRAQGFPAGLSGVEVVTGTSAPSVAVATAPAPAPVAAPAPAPSNQQAAIAPATPGFVYAGRWMMTIDCPNASNSPFAEFPVLIGGPSFTHRFYRDGSASGTISGAALSYQMTWTGREGNNVSGRLNLTARGPNQFGGGGIINGFTRGNEDRPCTASMKRD